MWTGDGRVFFYNPSQRLSLWEKPEELLGRSDVDKLIQGKPDGNQGELIKIVLLLLVLCACVIRVFVCLCKMIQDLVKTMIINSGNLTPFSVLQALELSQCLQCSAVWPSSTQDREKSCTGKKSQILLLEPMLFSFCQRCRRGIYRNGSADCLV